MPISVADLQMLNDVCNTICYHLTAHLAAVAAGVQSNLPPEVGQIYQLAAKLPKAEPAKWLALSPAGAAAAAAKPSGEGGAKGSGGTGRSRVKWTSEMEAELVKLVEDEAFRADKLGKEGTRGGHLNWAALGRHFGFSSTGAVKNKYSELKGVPVEKKERKAEAADGEKPAKKVKTEAAPAPAAPVAAAPAAAAEDAGPTPAAEKWSKKMEAELVKLVEDEDARKAAFGKKKLRWKRIAEHFDRKAKACKRHYHKVSGKEAPEDDD